MRPRSHIVAWMIAFVSVTAAGVVYRHVAKTAMQPVRLPVPLERFPMEVGAWSGEDVPIAETVLKVAQNDDYLCRGYRRLSPDQSATLYVAFSSRPRTMLGHRPTVCYVNSGWSHEGTDRSEIRSGEGQAVPCLIHRFREPMRAQSEIIVLNYYIVNGNLTTDESVFTGLGWRTPNIGGNAARYVAQVQISSVQESAARALGEDLTDAILKFLPDSQGRVEMAEQAQAGSQ